MINWDNPPILPTKPLSPVQEPEPGVEAVTTQTSRRFPYLIGLILLTIVITGILTYIFIYAPRMNNSNLSPTLRTEQGQTNITSLNLNENHPSDYALAQVGEEKIYQSDLDKETAVYPPLKNFDVMRFLLDKIATDSAILQGAQEDGLIKLDNSVFNSPNKDYYKRIKLVSQIKQDINNQADSIQGSVVSIWFYNMNLGSLTYDQAKALAYTKIKKIHGQVKSGKMTIGEAGRAISSDDSLIQIDKSYKSNAIFNFSAIKNEDNEKITFDPKLDAILWGLQEGEISDIYLAKDKPGELYGKEVEAAYFFGQVTKKVQKGKAGFSEWLNQKQIKYFLKYE